MCGRLTNLIFLGLTLALITAGTAKAFDINDPYLVGYWSFDEGAGTVATDLSENGYDGTLLGGTSWTDGSMEALCGSMETMHTWIPVGVFSTALTDSHWPVGSAQVILMFIPAFLARMI